MALTPLSPWPMTESGVARLRLRAEGGFAELSDDALDRLGATASALVEQYASSAPQVLRDEAVLRVVGRLLDTPGASLRSEQAGELRSDYAPSMTGALLHSGAKSLLYPWRRKTAGVAR